VSRRRAVHGIPPPSPRVLMIDSRPPPTCPRPPPANLPTQNSAPPSRRARAWSRSHQQPHPRRHRSRRPPCRPSPSTPLRYSRHLGTSSGITVPSWLGPLVPIPPSLRGSSYPLSDKYVPSCWPRARHNQVQAIPEIHRGRPEPDYRPYSPTALAPLHDDLSPSHRKRRRLSTEDDLEDARERTVPRIHRSPRAYPSSTASPMSGSRRASVLSMAESWTSSTRTSPHAPPRGPPAPSSFDAASITRSEWRPQLPSLPALTFDRAGPRAPSSWDERGFDSATLPTPPTEPPPTHTLPAPYAYPQPRGLSYSGPSTSPGSPHYRAPFSNIHPAGFTGFPYLADAADGEGKQRRRRGNLPKETTDKLRAWFLTHLGHPYPAEDEKQELMRQTGLQMSKFNL
jgi:hypothetical protein